MARLIALRNYKKCALAPSYGSGSFCDHWHGRVCARARAPLLAGTILQAALFAHRVFARAPAYDDRDRGEYYRGAHPLQRANPCRAHARERRRIAGVLALETYPRASAARLSADRNRNGIYAL